MRSCCIYWVGSILVGLHLCLVFSCAAGDAYRATRSELGPKGYLNSGRHPDFPQARYLSAVGVSTQSKEDAELRSHARIAEAISSQVSSEFESLIEQVSSGEQKELVESLRTQILVTSSFKHHELMRTVPELTRRDGDTWYVFSALDRRAAAGALSAELRQYKGHLRELEALMAASQDNPFSFTPLYHRATGELTEAMEVAAQIRAVGAGSGELAELVETGGRLRSMAITVRAMARVAIHSPTEDGRDELTVAIAQALGKLGLSTQTTVGCDGSLALNATAQSRCKAKMGVLCAAAVSVELCSCDQAQCTSFALPDVHGHHRSSEAMARSAAIAAVGTSEDVQQILHDILNRIVPLDTTGGRL